ncbi:MAG: phytanoyl-CoA dioxygenase family protein [Pseudomonadota bacterium]|nr:phytanoyl-CoA dioxygenase family protein [Pseudomonadota bacterium]
MGKLLTDDQVKHYREYGFVSPVSVLTEDEASECVAEIEAFEVETGKQIDFPYKSRCHQLFSWADRIVHHPKILDAVEDLIGPDILCYHATLWVKPPRSNSFVRWHQDGTYFFLDPAVQVTAWVALTVADDEAGCMQVIPGSHRNDFVEHDDDSDPGNLIPRGQGIASEVDATTATSMPLQAGQMSIHHTKLFHASFNNNRDIRRIGLGISYIPTSVRDVGDAKAHALLVRGEDRFNNFLAEKRLLKAGTEEQFDYHLELMKRFRQRQDQGASFSKASLA